MEPKTTKKKPIRKISDPNSRNPTPSTEPNEPEVVELEPETTQVYDNDVLAITKEPPQKLNDDPTKSTPWWWQFTLRNNDNKDGVTTTFPPWFQEVEATEFPAWIKKTVNPKHKVEKEKEKIIKKIRLKENKKIRAQKLLESKHRLRDENKIEKKSNTQDLVHGNDVHPGQQRQIQISRHFRLPQQNLPSKYHAARQPGKFKKKHKSDSSRTYMKRSNFTVPLRRPLFRARAQKTQAPNNVHDVVYTVEPNSYPDYETTTTTEKDEQPSKDKTNEIDESDQIPESRRKSNPSKIRQASPNRINQRRYFLNKVRKQKNLRTKLRSQNIRSGKPKITNRKRVTNRISSHYKVAEDRINNELESIDEMHNDLGRRRHNYDSLDTQHDDRDDSGDVTTRNNFEEYEIDKEKVRPDRYDIDEEDIITFEQRHIDETEKPRTNEDTESKQGRLAKFHRPRPRLNRLRQIMDNRRKKGDLRDTLHDEHFPAMTPDDFENIDLLPNPRVTQVADIFRPNTIHTSNLVKLFESKKTQLTLLEPTPSGWSTKTVQPPLSNSRFLHNLHEHKSPPVNSDNLVLNPSPSHPYSVPVALSTTMSKTATKEAIKSAKSKSKCLFDGRWSKLTA